MKLNIIYEDTHLLVLYKPAGVPVQSASVGQEDCVSILKNYFYDQQKAKGREPYVGVIHRLDQPVEGLLIFAKTPFAAKELSRQVTDGTMQKYYLALCHPTSEKKNASILSTGGKCGNTIHNVDNVDRLVDKSGIYSDFLLKNGKTNTSAVVPEHTKGGKQAILEYEVLQDIKGSKLVKIKLITGRHHQIRVQMAYHGNPLVGDSKYGPQSVERKDVDKSVQKDRNVALCAYLLKVIHPKTGKPMQFEICPEHPLLKEAYEAYQRA